MSESIVESIARLGSLFKKVRNQNFKAVVCKYYQYCKQIACPTE